MTKISVIVPTYNEKENMPELTKRIKSSFSSRGIEDFEILIMDDDSPDGTVAFVDALRDPRVRAVNRRGLARGLSQAVIHGFKEAKGEVLVVMDADLSHPPEVLPLLVQAIESGISLAVGSRYVHGGGVKDWPFKRAFASRMACFLAWPVTTVKDATSGFFAFRKNIIQGVNLSPLGFKIGLEVFVKSKHENRIKEVPYVFTDRTKGQSKLAAKIIGQYLQQIMSLLRER